MALEGLHHVTAITGDAQRNVDFYAGVLGLRMVKKTVNFDQPDVYHLYYADEHGTPGSVLTFFEFPGATPGRAGDGMVHTIQWRVGSTESLGFWAERLAQAGVTTNQTDTLRFADSEGLAHELIVESVADAPLTAHADGIATEHALQGFAGVRAYAADPARSAALLEHLGFSAQHEGSTWTLRGTERGATLHYDRPPAEAGRQSGGSVHHVAWSAAGDDELSHFRTLASERGAHATPIIDRQYFHSVYFREPSGVLFEIASRDIGFAVDEPEGELGRHLMLPPQYESRRAELLQRLTPLIDPRR